MEEWKDGRMEEWKSGRMGRLDTAEAPGGRVGASDVTGRF